MTQAVMTLVLALSGVAWAHPGEHHGDMNQTLFHLMTEPDHLAMLVAAGIAGGVAALVMRRRAARARARRMFTD